MDLADLVHAILTGDLLAARQWVADSQRAPIEWERCEKPAGLDEREMIVAAGLVELLAGRVDLGSRLDDFGWTARRSARARSGARTDAALV